MNKTNQLSEGSIKKVTCSNCGSIIKIAQHPRRQIAYVTCSCGHRIEGNELNKTNQNDTKQLNDLKPFKHGQEGTHGCCQEIHDTLGGKATCCECTGHKCKSNYLEIPNSSNSNDTKQCNHSWIQDAPIKVCYHCGLETTNVSNFQLKIEMVISREDGDIKYGWNNASTKTTRPTRAHME